MNILMDINYLLFHITFTGDYTIKKGYKNDKSEHVYYQLNIQSTININAKWSIIRRYNDFERFHNNIKKYELLKDKIPILPSKNLIRSFKKSYILKKIDELSNYMLEISLIKDIYHYDEFSAFILGKPTDLSLIFESLYDIVDEIELKKNKIINDLNEQINELNKRCKLFKRNIDLNDKNIENIHQKYQENLNEKSIKFQNLQLEYNQLLIQLENQATESVTSLNQSKQQQQQVEQQQEVEEETQKKKQNQTIELLKKECHHALKEVKKYKIREKVLVAEVKDLRKDIQNLKNEINKNEQSHIDEINLIEKQNKQIVLQLEKDLKNKKKKKKNFFFFLLLFLKL